MRILYIRFKNLNSLVGEWEIDLSHPAFTSNGIFAITGPTGAGKTTILDAICLALYGRTPRLSKITKSDNEIMSRHTGVFCRSNFETLQENTVATGVSTGPERKAMVNCRHRNMRSQMRLPGRFLKQRFVALQSRLSLLAVLILIDLPVRCFLHRAGLLPFCRQILMNEHQYWSR